MISIINALLLGGTVVTWSKDSQVLSADNVKVLMDSRLRVQYTPLGGVNISIRQDDHSEKCLPLTKSLVLVICVALTLATTGVLSTLTRKLFTWNTSF